LAAIERAAALRGRGFGDDRERPLSPLMSKRYPERP
jgi:hypothetical protein